MLKQPEDSKERQRKKKGEDLQMRKIMRNLKKEIHILEKENLMMEENQKEI